MAGLDGAPVTSPGLALPGRIIVPAALGAMAVGAESGYGLIAALLFGSVGGCRSMSGEPLLVTASAAGSEAILRLGSPPPPRAVEDLRSALTTALVETSPA